MSFPPGPTCGSVTEHWFPLQAEKTGNAMADYNNAAFLAFDAARAWCAATEETPGATTPKPWNKLEPNLSEIVGHVAEELKVPRHHPLVCKVISNPFQFIHSGQPIHL